MRGCLVMSQVCGGELVAKLSVAPHMDGAKQEKVWGVDAPPLGFMECTDPVEEPR